MRNWIIGIIIVTLGMLAGLFYGLYYMRIDWLQIIMVVFTAYGMTVIFLAAVVKPRKFLNDPEYRPYLSLIIPARNEEFVIARTIRSMMKLDYYKDGEIYFEVILMDDNSSDNTLEKAMELTAEFPNLKVIHRSAEIGGKGKSDVLNHAMREAKGEVIGVFDADTEVSPDFIEKCIHLLSDPKVGGVQGRVRLYNKNKNILTSLQEDEFATISHLYQLGKEYIGGMTALGGNGQFVKREALESVDGWNYLSPTEDLDLTFKLLFKGWDVRYAPDSVLWQEGVERVYPFVRQRVRWAEGFLKCIFDYIVPLVFGKYPFMKKFDGVMTMGRILIPFYVWIGYAYVVISMMNGLEIHSRLVYTLIGVSSWLFLVAMIIGMWRVSYPNIFVAIFKVIQYSIYGALWIVAIPWGFINCGININDIKWDKTTHTGSSRKSDSKKKADVKLSEAGA